VLPVRDRHLPRAGGEQIRSLAHSALRRAAGVRNPDHGGVLRAPPGDGSRGRRDRGLPRPGTCTGTVQSAGRLLVLSRGRLDQDCRSAALLRLHVRGGRLLHLPGIPALRPAREPLSLAARRDPGGRGVRELLQSPLAAGPAGPDRDRLRHRAVAESGWLHRGPATVCDAAQSVVRADRVLPVGRGERSHLARRLAVSGSSRLLAAGTRRQVGLVGVAGEPELRPGRRGQAGRGPVLQLTAAPGSRLSAPKRRSRARQQSR